MELLTRPVCPQMEDKACNDDQVLATLLTTPSSERSSILAWTASVILDLQKEPIIVENREKLSTILRSVWQSHTYNSMWYITPFLFL